MSKVPRFVDRFDQEVQRRRTKLARLQEEARKEREDETNAILSQSTIKRTKTTAVGTATKTVGHKNYFKELKKYERKRTQNLEMIANGMNSNTYKPEQCKKTNEILQRSMTRRQKQCELSTITSESSKLKRRKSDALEPTFKPTISERAKKMGKRTVPVHEILIKKGEQSRERLNLSVLSNEKSSKTPKFEISSNN